MSSNPQHFVKAIIKLACNMLITYCHATSSINPHGRGVGRAKKINSFRDECRDTEYQRGGRPPKDDRLMLEAMLWRVRTGAPWRDLPPLFGPWPSVYTRFRRWSAQGLWSHLLRHFARDADIEQLCVDATIVRAHQHAAGGAGGYFAQALGRSRGGLTTKIHTLCDALGYPLFCLLTGGERHESTQTSALLRHAPAGFGSLLADTGYDSDAFREGVMQQGGTATIPANPSRAQKPAFDKHLYTARHLIENLFCKLKHNRAVATRYDKLQRHYLASVHLACVRLWLFH